MTTPSPEELETAANFSGIQKDYIRATVKSLVTAEINNLRTEILRAIGDANTPTSSDNVLSSLKKRVEDVEARYNEDDKYTLTPAKLVMLQKKMGIE
jgi:chaperonin cofactor prefoldin